MIQTKTPITYGDRDEKFGIIRLEVRPLQQTKSEGTKYLVIDWDVTDAANHIAVKSKEVLYSNEKIDQVDAYLESQHDFSEMTKTEKEWKKIELGLMLDTQTNLFSSGKTIYRQNPNDWEFTPETV